jgi:hypothetical protein
MLAADKDVICFYSIVNKKKLHFILFAVPLYSASLPEGPEYCGKIISKVRFGGKKMRPKRRERRKKHPSEWNKKSVD